MPDATAPSATNTIVNPIMNRTIPRSSGRSDTGDELEGWSRDVVAGGVVSAGVDGGGGGADGGVALSSNANEISGECATDETSDTARVGIRLFESVFK